MTSETITANPLEGYVLESEMAKIRGVTQRTLRAERQRGGGPPFIKDGWRIYYSIAGFREWFKARERQPVRSGA